MAGGGRGLVLPQFAGVGRKEGSLYTGMCLGEQGQKFRLFT